jgi:hypothetical protein
VNPCCVGGVRHPAEAGTRAAVEHRGGQFFSQAAAAGRGLDDDVRQVGGGHAVRDRAGEADEAP